MSRQHLLYTVGLAIILAGPAVAASTSGAANHPLYVGLTNTNAVDIFAPVGNGDPIGQITDGIDTPIALATDAAGTLYVGNKGNNTITAYPLGATSPATTYTTGISDPGELAIGPDGSLYVSNLVGETVEQFPPGSTTPSRTISFAGTSGQTGIALDAAGNLYVETWSNGDIEEFAPGSTTGTNLGFNFQEVPYELAIDRKGNFIVNQYQDGLHVYAAAAPHNELYGFALINGQQGSIALSHSGKSLYVTDTVFNRVVRMAYPQGNIANVMDGVAGNAVAITPELND